MDKSFMNPKISIIIPAYNEEKYLKLALESVERQTFDHNLLEVIVVNNASNDGTPEVFTSFLGKNTVKMILLEEPVLGVSRAKNKGVMHALGEVLIFLDADSQMSENLTEVVNSYYERGFPAGIIKLIADTPDLWGRFFFDLIDFGKRVFRIKAQMGYCSKKIFWEAGGFDPQLKHAEDLAFFTKVDWILRKKGKSFSYIKEAWILTSTRRMDRLPFHLGYPLVMMEWLFGGLLGLRRKSYRPIR